MPEMEQPTNSTTANNTGWENLNQEVAFDQTAATNLEALDQAVIHEDAMATGAEAAEAAMAAADLAESVSTPATPEEGIITDEALAANLEGMNQAEIQSAAEIAAVEAAPDTTDSKTLPGDIIEGPSIPEATPKTDLEQVNDIINKYSDPNDTRTWAETTTPITATEAPAENPTNTQPVDAAATGLSSGIIS